MKTYCLDYILFELRITAVLEHMMFLKYNAIIEVFMPAFGNAIRAYGKTLILISA